MSNVNQTIENMTEIWCNKTFQGDGDTVFNNRYMIFALIVGGLVWILIFKSLYYWFVRDVTGLMIWFNARELYRRLQLQTSNGAHRVNGLNAWGVDNIKPIKTQAQIDELILRSEHGDLNNTYNSYADLTISSPQMITVLPTPQGYKPVVESVQIFDEHVVDTTSDHLGGFYQKKIHTETDTSSTVKRRIKQQQQQQGVTNVEKKSRTSTTFGDLENDPKGMYDEELISMYDDDGDNNDDQYGRRHHHHHNPIESEEKPNTGGIYWIASVLFCDQYRTKSRKKCCPWTLDFSAFKKDTEKKRKWKGRNDLSDYERTVEDPNDQLSIDINDRKRFWRGNFFILLCDFIVLMSIALVLIGIYLSMDVELDSYFSAQNIALVVAAFKFTEISSSFVGYIYLIMHSTIYRGDIVKIVGTWTGIGGSVSGVVLDINISDVLLLANTPFVSHFGVKNTKPDRNDRKRGSKKSKTSQKTVVHNEKNNTKEEDVIKSEDDQTIHTRRYLPLHTASSAPKLRGKMTEEQLRKLASDFGGRYEREDATTFFSERDNRTKRPRTKDTETIGYIRFDQKDVETQDGNVKVIMERTMNDIEIVRLNTNMVYTSVVSRILGFETNIDVSFYDV